MMPADFKGEAALAEGKELYTIFCNHCHGPKGDGNGHLVEIGKFPAVPDYKSRDITAGSIYHVIMYGKNLMGSHASQLSNEERWKIVRYVQDLRGDVVNETAETADAVETNTEETAVIETIDQQS
jgi:mono/diheme cytochrome c family protein